MAMKEGGIMATKKPRLTVTVDDELKALIDDYQKRNNFPDRSMALAALVHAGIEATKHETDPAPKVHKRAPKTKKDDAE